MFDRAAYFKEYRKARYARLKAEGRCFDCEKILMPEDGGKVRCKACREYSSHSNKARFQKLKAEGLCFRCMAPLGEDKHVYCPICREKLRIYAMGKKAKA